MLSKIASGSYALPAGIVILVSLIFLGCSYHQNLSHPSLWIYYGYLSLSAVGIICLDLARRKFNSSSRRAQARFGRAWRAIGLCWHVLGTVVATTAALWSTGAQNLVTSGDLVRDLHLSFALNLSFLVAAQLAVASLITQSIQFFRVRFVQAWMASKKRRVGLLAFFAFFIPSVLFTLFVPSVSYKMVRFTTTEIPSPAWVVLIGSIAAALLIISSA
ncbi:hypothetical protein C8J33_11523 [Rhizobium sp. PP-CC-3G-465]|nr:hypothetical protein C8J33_11523 [Rhizobium sp. PP-CC-3G-465]